MCFGAVLLLGRGRWNDMKRLCQGAGVTALFLTAARAAFCEEATPPVAALHRAVIVRDAAEAARLIEAGAPVNDPGPGGWLALHLAARRGWTDGIDLLFGHGADPNGSVGGW